MKGYFCDEKKEYVIRDMYPVRPLYNYLWSEHTVSTLDHFGNGFTTSVRDGKWRNIETGTRNFYIKDRVSGEYYSANRNYKREPFDVFECHVGLGYQLIVSQYKGIRTEITFVIPNDLRALMTGIKVKNVSSEKKSIDLYTTTEPVINMTAHYSEGEAFFSKEANGLIFSHDAFEYELPYKHVYLSSAKEFYGYDVTNSRFKGIYEGYENPVALCEDRLASIDINADNNHVGAFQFRLDLEAGEEWENVLLCGLAETTNEAITHCNYCTLENFAKELKLQENINNEYLDVFVLDSPDKILNSQVNVWLKRQLAFGKTWGRLWGKGFRDVMQDITSFAPFDAELAKKRILYALKHVYENGNPIRMFEPTYLYPYNDGAIWVPSAILAYLNETGDLSILDEQVQYLPGSSLDNSVYDDGSFSYPKYKGTEYTDSVFEHVKRCMDYIIGSRGEKGLVLFRGGDWNDSINSAGKLGKGESVWLSIATYKALKEFEEILTLYKKEELVPYYAEKREELKGYILENGKDGDHFLYGYNDYGLKIGSDENDEAKIFLNPQTWAVLAGLVEKEELEKIMDVVEERLVCDFGYVQCAPSYVNPNPNIGRVTYMKPGLVENGSVYNHGVAFKLVADCILGRGDTAYNTYLKIRYDNPKNADSGVEPYAVTNMYIGPENPYRKGYARNNWITGTAGWLYRGLTEYFCGIVPTFTGLKILPNFPKAWNKVNIKRKYRNSVYDVHFERGEENLVIVDGEKIIGEILPFGKSEYSVKVIYK